MKSKYKGSFKMSYVYVLIEKQKIKYLLILSNLQSGSNKTKTQKKKNHIVLDF